MPVFVNYAGPKLDKKQRQLVRSQAMVAVRGQQKQAKSRQIADVTVLSLNPRWLAPARERDEDEEERTSTAAQPGNGGTRPNRPAPNTSRKRDKLAVARSQQHQRPNLNPYDLRGAPPQSTHMTGVDARTFQDYMGRCGSYSSYLDEAYVLVGFRQQSYFRPDLTKAACIYIGYLLTGCILDAFRGAKELNYPYYEYQAVKELQVFIDGADSRELYEVVYPVMVLGMFEMIRFSPRATTHFAAVERFIKSRGGLKKMPEPMQHLVIMGDLLHSVCMDSPLAFNVLGLAPTRHIQTADGFLAGDQLLSCPLLLCNDEDFSLVSRYVDPCIRLQLAGVLQAANDSFRQFFDLDAQAPFDEINSESSGLAVNLDAIADSPIAPNNVAGLFLETCALAARIMRRTLEGTLDGFDDVANELDVLTIHDNTRFIGLKAWIGLPYVYVWVNLIGFVAARTQWMRSYFVAEVNRCAFSYGCYQMDVFQGVIKNFLHLRNAIAGRKIAMSVLLDGGYSSSRSEASA